MAGMGHELRKDIVKFGLDLISILLISSACTPMIRDTAGLDNAVTLQTDRPSQNTPKPELESDLQSRGGAWYAETCDYSQFTPITDFEIRQIPTISEPAARASFVDPVFGTCLVRVTDRMLDLAPSDSSLGMKNEYSRVQSFNADESRLLVFTTEGNWYLYDALSLQPIGQLPIWHEPRWDAEDPDLLYFTEGTRLMSYRVSAGLLHVVHEFTDDIPRQSLSAVWMRYEGSPSIDGRYWGLMAEDQEWMTIALLIYDMEVDKVVAMRETLPSEIDSVTISPLGNYYLAYYDHDCENGQLGYDDNPCGLMVYDRDLADGRGLLRIIGHSDLALDADGQEVLVYQDIDTDFISMLDLSDGEITTLWPIDFSHSALGFHFSGQAFSVPGWVLVSTSNGTHPSSTWMDDQIFALELLEAGRVIRLAHTHSIYDESIEHDYWAEPHASVNRDFTQIVFTSNWGRSGSEQVDMYVIKLPNKWISLLP